MEPGRKRKFLVVDDDEVVLETTRHLLTERGFDVVVRDSALGTSGDLLRQEPDFVLLDVMMPALSGDKLAELIGQHCRAHNIGVILFSSKDPASLRELVRRTGALGAVSKQENHGRFVQDLLALVQAHDQATAT